MGVPGGGVAKRVVLESLGWILVVVGVAALVLPGPGLIAIFAGLVLLSQQYEWADRRVEPVRLRAMRGAADSVETWPRIVGSCLAALVLMGFGVLWIMDPPAPGWWSLRESWWLPGGIWTGVTQVASGLFAIGLIIYSYRRFHHRPEARAELDEDISTADSAAD
ncbi:MAG: PGPGW domain-containing protein [Nocardioides sp.]|nr:PGPGW domain-containing protein [Nocardioides sp.]